MEAPSQDFVLHLFSGPSTRQDSFAHYARQVRLHCIDFDLINGEAENLACDQVWARVRSLAMQDNCRGALMGPPCETFSRARMVSPGPPPLRSPQHPYGEPGVPARYKEQLRLANLLALRTAELAKQLHHAGKAFIIENPERWDMAAPAIWLLTEFVELAQTPGIRFVHGDQCRFGGKAKKPTSYLHCNVDLQRLQVRCNHPEVTWTRGDGSTYNSPHEQTAAQNGRPVGH